MAGINEFELVKRQFRDIARTSVLVFLGFLRRYKSVRQIQASSGLFYDVLKKVQSKEYSARPIDARGTVNTIEQQRLIKSLEEM